jgi:hypothetical protein
MFLVIVGCLLDFVATPWQRVRRSRLDKFARRQSLPITVENGPLVIRYLATTRRWRGGGLLVALTVTLFWPLFVSLVRPQDAVSSGLGVNALALFAGWFAGAVVAEWRVSSLANTPGPHRSAALVPRRLDDYLPRAARWSACAAWAIAGASELAVLGGLLARRSGGVTIALGWIAATAVAAVGLGLVGRQVLVRPQRHTDPGLIAADDALRSRSLHALAGSAMAIAGYLLAGFGYTLGPYSPVLDDGFGTLLGGLGAIALPILGFNVATSVAAPIRRARRTAVLDPAP